MQVVITALICIYYKYTTPPNILFFAQDLAPEVVAYCLQASRCPHALRKVHLLPRTLPRCESLPLHESWISLFPCRLRMGERAVQSRLFILTPFYVLNTVSIVIRGRS